MVGTVEKDLFVSSILVTGHLMVLVHDIFERGFVREMVFSYHSVLLVACVPLLCFVPFVPCSFLVVCCIYSCLLFIVFGTWSVSVFGPFGISPDIPRYLRYRYPTRYRSNMS